jgi:hypothetical protein
VLNGEVNERTRESLRSICKKMRHLGELFVRRGMLQPEWDAYIEIAVELNEVVKAVPGLREEIVDAMEGYAQKS